MASLSCVLTVTPPSPELVEAGAAATGINGQPMFERVESTADGVAFTYRFENAPSYGAQSLVLGLVQSAARSVDPVPQVQVVSFE